jgi:hypothetical protein
VAEASAPRERSERQRSRVLGRRALNRALLERQLLTRRRRLAPVRVVERLVGLQAQLPEPPYVGLWSRIAGFRPESLSRLLDRREVVRIALMRGTIHLVTARDALALRPVVQPAFLRWLSAGAWGKALAGLDVDPLVTAGREYVEAAPRTFDELGRLLAPRWPDRDPAALAQAIRGYLLLVQVPPRGLWRRSGPAAHTTAEHWLGQPLAAVAEPDEVLLRYLAAFGPATIADMRCWSGLTGLREVVDRLRPRLRTLRDDRGRELFDLPDAPRPDPDAPVPVRFVAPFDNLLLSHEDRTRVLPEEYRKLIFSKNGIVLGSVLVDGFVQGAWRIDRARDTATLVVESFQALPDEVAEEGTRLLEFMAPGADHEIRVVVR